MTAFPACIQRAHVIGPACRERFVPLDRPHAAPLREFGVAMAGVSELHPPYDQGRVHPRFHLLLHTFAGSGAALIDDRREMILAGSTWVIPAGVPHRYVVAEAPWRILWFHLADDGRFARLRAQAPRAIERGYPERFAMMIETLIAESRSPVPGALRMGQLCSQAIAIYVERRLAAFAGRDEDAVSLEALWSRVSADLAHPWTVPAIAAAGGLPVNRLMRLMDTVMHRTPMAYLTQLRIEAARRLLLQGDLTLAEIAPRVGYASAFALSKAFKRVTGRAPRARGG
jgi:AraC-like DNA-binding protein